MSEIMQSMAQKLQVISITHLPQIASRGTNHYLVYKDHSGETSETHIRLLNKKERIAEIAKMLSGKVVSEAALENARNLLKN
jgi:DNA repair protein RecN (Recombination protein N)